MRALVSNMQLLQIHEHAQSQSDSCHHDMQLKQEIQQRNLI